MRWKGSSAAIAALVLLTYLLWLSCPLLDQLWPFLSLPSSPPTQEESTYISTAPQSEDKAIVMATTSADNTSWVSSLLPDWQQAIYHMDDPTHPLHPPANKGREAMAYLTFIVSHYAALPAVIVFLHPHRNGWPQAWHTDAPDYDNVNSIHSLRLEYVREHGYANMRCIHNPGCPDEIQPFRNDPERKYEMAFADAYTYMFGGNHSSVPRIVGAACCAQFAVSATQIRKRPKEEYVRYRKWLLETELDDDDSGRVMEYMWHIIFGKEAVWCPDLTTCWCEQFGRC